MSRLVIAAIVLLSSLIGHAARGDEIAPELESTDLRVRAQLEWKRLVLALDAKDRRRLIGAYTAFDPNASDPRAQVACDDDGDYVVVLSDALLRLLSYVARADRRDELDGSTSLDDYAAFLARTQVPGRRLLPPAVGSYRQPTYEPSDDERWSDMLDFVLAHELARLRAGDLSCPKPTATKEIGDDVWSPEEQRKASEATKTVYPSSQAARDEEGLSRLLDAARPPRGALAFLRFFAVLDGQRGRFSTSYSTLHPNASERLANAKRLVERRGAEPL